MEDLLIECSPGISGDMLLAAFYDLGVPKEVIEKPLIDLGLGGCYLLSFSEAKSRSLRGIKSNVNSYCLCCYIICQSKCFSFGAIKNVEVAFSLRNVFIFSTRNFFR